jgi:hypothetical protein
VECEGASQVAYDALEACHDVYEMWKQAFELSRPAA